MPDEGSAYICGHSMQREMAKARQLVGYCPQFDALAGTLTGKEDLLLCTAPKLTFLLALENLGKTCCCAFCAVVLASLPVILLATPQHLLCQYPTAVASKTQCSVCRCM